MKTNYLILVLLLALMGTITKAQTASHAARTIDSLANFNENYWSNFYYSKHTSSVNFAEFINSQKKDYIRKTFYQTQANPARPQSPQQACTNIDFEAGNLNGWNLSTGYNPLYNSAGCCQLTGGAQTIVSGAGTDNCGGFPLVAPGGNFSVRLGNNGTGGIADRLEQTFNVTSANANFTYKYAVVFEDPGHTLSEQPSFQIEMLDSSGNSIPCTYYNVAAGQNIPGFQNSSNCGNVVFKPWTSVSVDLTNYIGQNVTIRFTTYDCALGGHYAYAYIDGSCLDFNIGQSGMLCQGSTVQLAAPAGFAAYNWLLPDNTVQTGQIITTGLTGVYTLNLITVTGCPGPTLTYTLTSVPKPIANFTTIQSSVCSPSISFVNTSTNPGGNIAANSWTFGDGNTATTNSAFNIYAATGNYNVQLIVTGNSGCTDTVMYPVTVKPFPTVAFSANNVCLNGLTSYTNTSSVSTGSIIAYNWQFGDGSVSGVSQPAHQYSSAGVYNVTLTATTDYNCSSSVAVPVTVYPLPNASFAVNNVCLGGTTNYYNTTNISAGSVTNYVWDFTSDGAPDNTSFNCSNLFNAPGVYNTQLMAISDHNCVAMFSAPVQVYPQPTIQFSALPVCEGAPLTFTNSSSVSSGQIISYSWNFGDNTSSVVTNPAHTYANYGTYNVVLTATTDHNCINAVQGSVVVNPKPSVNFLSTITCLNQATQFSNQSNIVAGSIIKYRWDFQNDGVMDDSTANPTYIYPSAGTLQSRLVAVSNNHCLNQTIQPVIVHFNPVANFSVPSVCMPSASQFSNLSTSSDGNITAILWDFNGDNITDNTQPSPQYNFAQTGNFGVKLEVQTQYGCTNTIIKSAYVNATPTASFTAQNNIGCPSLCVQFANHSSIGSGQIVTNQWIFGDNSLPDYSVNPSHCYGTGNYNVILKVVSDSGCVSSTTLPGLVTVHPVPVADFNVTPSEVEITTPLIEVTDKSLGASAVKYVFSDGTVKNSPDFSHTFNTDVAKTVYIKQQVKNSFGCMDSIVKSVTIKPNWVIYVPNAFTPNSDGLNDGFKAMGIGIVQFKIQIFDRWGALIFESDDIEKAWDGSVNGKGNDETSKQEVYVWKAQVTDIFSNKHDLMGHVTLLK